MRGLGMTRMSACVRVRGGRRVPIRRLQACARARVPRAHLCLLQDGRQLGAQPATQQPVARGGRLRRLRLLGGEEGVQPVHQPPEAERRPAETRRGKSARGSGTVRGGAAAWLQR